MNKLTQTMQLWRVPFWLALALGNGLLLAPEGSLPRSLGALLVLLLPGLIIATVINLTEDGLLWLVIGLGLGYLNLMIGGLLLHYWPGPISLPGAALLFNGVSVAGLAWLTGQRQTRRAQRWPAALWPLLLIVLAGAAFRLPDLGYSEFDGDEVKALLPAAEAIEGQPDALYFERKKGPGEILAPALTWRLTGLVNEQSARLPFAVAGIAAIAAIYLAGATLFSERVGLLAAGLLALNGYMVAFSRTVQYQQLVVWFSLLALLCAWQWRRSQRAVWPLLAGLFLAAGLLAHYDAILAAPALAYILAADFRRAWARRWQLLGGLAGFGLLVGLFFAPFVLSPQLTRTGAYLEQRIGAQLLKNSLDDFFFHTIFYNSLYFVVIVGLLALAWLAWAVSHLPGLRRWPGSGYLALAAAVASLWALALYPAAVQMGPVNLAFVPVSLLFLGAVVSPALGDAERAVVIWLAAAFLGYNFLIGDPRTHFYVIVPPWLLIAALAAAGLWAGLSRRWGPFAPLALALATALLLSGYLYVVYLRRVPEFETDWPAGESLLYQFPYDQLSDKDNYGMVRRTGWKAIGGLFLEGQLTGSYQTNGLLEVAGWYTRHQPLNCYHNAANLLVVSHRLMDMRELPAYRPAGEVSLPNRQGIAIYQPQPVTRPVAPVDWAALHRRFDQSATPAAFVRPPTVYTRSGANLAGLALLTGYEIGGPPPAPGTDISVTLEWRALKPVPVSGDVFVQLEGPADSPGVWGQANSAPACGQRPTTTWQPGEAIIDRHLLTISPDTPPGEYRLIAGLYLPEQNLRAPVLDEAGQPAGEAVTLATFRIE